MTGVVASTGPLKFCPECQERGWRSKVYVGGMTSTLMATQSWYDEDGKFHFENPNMTTTEYSCSHGHRWKETV